MYIGPYAIAGEDTQGEFTTVTFKPSEKKIESGETLTTDHHPQTFGNEVLEALKTEEPTDLNFIRSTRCNIIARDILSSMLKHNATVGEMGYLFQLVQKSLQKSIDRASEKVWKVDFCDDGLDNRSLVAIDTIIKS